MYRAEDVAAVYLATFATAPRHSIWQGSHWLPQATVPATEAVVSALAGDGPPLSVYFLTDDATTHVAAIDVDDDDDDGWEAVEKITMTLGEAGVVAYPEHSRRGGHIWIVADVRLPAIVMRYAVMAAIERAGLDPTDKRLEIRPSTHRWSSEYAGGALRAPWMAHPATGQRYGLLDPRTFGPLHVKVAGALLDFAQVDHRAITALAERYMPAKAAPLPTAAKVTGYPIEQQSITAILEREWGIAAYPGKSIRCPLHDDHNPSFKIALDDRRAWCHSATCIAHENGRGITPWRLGQLAAGVAA